MEQSPTTEGAGFLPTQRVYLWLILALLFAAALAVRLYHISDPPVDFHTMRQYRSALIARGLYFEHLDSIPEWRREVARINKNQEEIIEPPLMEMLAATAYRVTGGEHLWIPRAFSALWWVIGGILLFFIGRRLFSVDAAFFAAAFYLLVPYGVIASRSFLPDPLMVMLTLLSIFLILRYYERPSIRRLVPAIVASAGALFVKPMAVFLIMAALVSCALQQQNSWKSLIRPRFLAFVSLMLLPPLIYYGNAVFIAGWLAYQPATKFIPTFPLTAIYWSGWFQMIGQVVGYTAFVGALIGLMIVQSKPARLLVGALWIGYFMLGLIFNYNIATHDYYHLPFIPVVALSMSPLADLVMCRVAQVSRSRMWRVTAAISVVMIAAILRAQEIRWRVEFEWFDETILRIAPEIGERVHHSTATILLSQSYGEPLRYQGELVGLAWPSASDFWFAGLRGIPALSVEERFTIYSPDGQAQYFIVTDFGEFQAQDNLRDFLFSHYPVLVQTPEYLIFDLRTKLND